MHTIPIIVMSIAIFLLLLIFFWLALRYQKYSAFNMKVRDFILRHRHPILDPIMYASHILNGAVFMSAFTALAAIILGLRWHAWKYTTFMTTIMLFETAFTHASKLLHKSERPPQIIAKYFMTTYSFPSGHSAASMTFAIVVPYFYSFFLSTPVTIALTTFLALNAFITAYGRLYLDKHWLFDVLGGWCMAVVTSLAGIFIFKLT